MVQLLLLHETHFQLKSPEWGNNSNSFGHYCSDSCKGLGSLFKYGCILWRGHDFPYTGQQLSAAQQGSLADPTNPHRLAVRL